MLRRHSRLSLMTAFLDGPRPLWQPGSKGTNTDDISAEPLRRLGGTDASSASAAGISPRSPFVLTNFLVFGSSLAFKVPAGIAYGQHWLNVKFPSTVVRVPFRILTKDEYKLLDKNYKDIEKQVKEAFAPPKKG